MIDGIISGKLLQKPKMMKTRRGSTYAIAKMLASGYKMGGFPAASLPADIIAFDRETCRALTACEAGQRPSLVGIIKPVIETEHGEPLIVLKMEARRLADGYAYGQAQGKGRLFRLDV